MPTVNVITHASPRLIMNREPGFKQKYQKIKKNASILSYTRTNSYIYHFSFGGPRRIKIKLVPSVDFLPTVSALHAR